MEKIPTFGKTNPMTKILYSAIVILCLTSCKDKEFNVSQQEKQRPLAQFNWLLGDWYNETGEEVGTEIWRKKNDSTIVGMSFIQMEMDTVFAEKIILQQNKDGITFTVSGVIPPEGSTVAFNYLPSEKEAFVFENKQNTFPQRIYYSNPVKDSIHAWIEGEINGQVREVHFSYNRKKML